MKLCEAVFEAEHQHASSDETDRSARDVVFVTFEAVGFGFREEVEAPVFEFVGGCLGLRGVEPVREFFHGLGY